MIPSLLLSNDWRTYLAAVRQFAGSRIVFSFFAILVLGMMEGGGLLILLPMLQVVGIESEVSQTDSSSFIGTIQDLGSHIPFTTLLGLFLLLSTGQTLTKITLARMMVRLQVNFTHFLRERLHRALTGADWSVFLQLRASDVIRSFTGEVNMAAMGLPTLSALASSIIQASVQTIAAFIIAPAVTVSALVVGTLIMVVVRPLSQRVREQSEAGQFDRGALAANITDHVGGLKLAKSHGAEDRRGRSFHEISQHVGERQINVSIFQTRSQAVFRIGSAAALCLVLWYAVALKGVHGAELAIMAVIFMRLVSHMMALQSSYQRMAHVFPAYRATEALRKKWLAAAETPIGSSAPATQLEHSLTFNDVTYRYPESERDALSGIALTLAAGKTTALCGHSGAGKSTLADLALGLISPTAGAVMVDSEPLEGATIRSWRRSVAYVPQDVFLLNDTVRENLLWLSPGASEDQLWSALKNALAADLVRNLPKGLDTVVGERGVRLSGGERQRIALARALLRQPSLLVLDEATSSLDNTNERLIKDAIDGLNGTMTILIIAHRLSTIRHADRIAVLDQGRVAQNGTWSELAADQSGVFSRMIDAAEI
ncbi:MAG: ABC transporter ATP-binding protein [Synoicihabitans sp.]